MYLIALICRVRSRVVACSRVVDTWGRVTLKLVAISVCEVLHR